MMMGGSWKGAVPFRQAADSFHSICAVWVGRDARLRGLHCAALFAGDHDKGILGHVHMWSPVATAVAMKLQEGRRHIWPCVMVSCAQHATFIASGKPMDVHGSMS